MSNHAAAAVPSLGELTGTAATKDAESATIKADENLIVTIKREKG